MFNFVKYKILFITVGVITIVVSLAAIFGFGLKPAIDFTGGTIIEVTSESLRNGDWNDVVRSVFLDAGVEVGAVQTSGDANVVIKTKEIDQTKWSEVQTKLKEVYPDLTEASFETIGPTLGRELLNKTLMAILLASVSLLVYIGWRFSERVYGVTAVVAMVHDVLVILGVFALLGHYLGVEVDVMFVTAALTTLAFSVHDTIVLYDRVRETLRRSPNDDFETVVNTAINATMVRSLSTTLTIIFVLVALLLLGGENIRWFVVALLVGTVTGVYSSPFIATQLLAAWKGRDRIKK